MTLVLNVELSLADKRFITVWLDDGQYDVRVTTPLTNQSHYTGPDKALALATVYREIAFSCC